VLRINWGVVRGDVPLREAVRGDELEKIFERIGVRSADVAEAVVFTQFADAGNSGGALILRGGAGRRPEVSNLRERGWGESAFGGYKIYTSGGGSDCLAQLRSGLLVVGSRGAVERVIGVESGDAKPFVSDANVRKLRAETSGAGEPVEFLLTLPQGYQDAGDMAVKAAGFLLDFTGFGPLGELMDTVGIARGIRFSLTHSGSSMVVNLAAVMKDEGAATLISGTLTLLKGATSLLPARDGSAADREARRAFEQMSVARVREVVSVKMTIPESSLPRGR
jgi:hypothetical protein